MNMKNLATEITKQLIELEFRFKVKCGGKEIYINNGANECLDETIDWFMDIKPDCIVCYYDLRKEPKLLETTDPSEVIDCLVEFHGKKNEQS